MNSLHRNLSTGEIVVIASFMFESPRPFMADRAFSAMSGTGKIADSAGTVLTGFWWSDAPDERGDEMQIVIATAIDSKDTAQFNAALKSGNIAALGLTEVLVNGSRCCARERDANGASETVPLFDYDGRFKFSVARSRVFAWSPDPDFHDDAAEQRRGAKQPRNGEIISPLKFRQLKRKPIIIEGTGS